MIRTWFVICGLVFSFMAHAQEYKTENGEVEFLSKAALNEFAGTSSQLQGLLDFDQNLLDFYIDLNTLKTGIGLRDRHMRENYLETKKFPFAEFTGKIKEEVKLSRKRVQEVTATGTFKIHGIERKIEVPGTITRLGNGEINLDAAFKVLLSDFNIDIPKVVFYELADEQEVTIKAKLKTDDE